jgi:hypothetical protein
VIWFNIIHLDIRAEIHVEADPAMTDTASRAAALGVTRPCGFEVHKPVLLRDFFPPVHIHLLAIVREIGWCREEQTYLPKYDIRIIVLVSLGVVKVFSSPSRQANGGPNDRESSRTVCGVLLENFP